jgi:DNA-binding transcriptional ArsR family regulator
MDAMNTEPAGVEVLREPDRIAVMMDPGRRRLVDALLERPDSAVGLARRLGDTRQRLNYHLRVMEGAGLVEVAEERPRRGVTERVYRVVARRFVLDPGSLGELSPEPVEGDRFSATYAVALTSRSIRELAELLSRSRSSGKRMASMGVSAEVRLAEPAGFNAFAEDLGRAVADVVARHTSDAPGGRMFRVIACAHQGVEDERNAGSDEEGVQ